LPLVSGLKYQHPPNRNNIQIGFFRDRKKAKKVKAIHIRPAKAIQKNLSSPKNKAKMGKWYKRQT
jgi:hypothetical protein